MPQGEVEIIVLAARSASPEARSLRDFFAESDGLPRARRTKEQIDRYSPKNGRVGLSRAQGLLG